MESSSEAIWPWANVILEIFLKVYFILRQRERERAGEGQREGEIEIPKHAPHCQHRDVSIPRPWDHDLSRNQESITQLSKPPGAPQCDFLNYLINMSTFEGSLLLVNPKFPLTNA